MNAPTAQNPIARVNGLSYGLRIVRGLKGRDPKLVSCLMPQSLSNLLTHLIFSTKNREPWLKEGVASEIHPYLVGVLSHLCCPSIQTGGVSDHVHLFFRLSRTKTVAEVVECVKTSSSKWVKSKDPELASFRWQSGYGAFSVSQSAADALISYIRNQEEHHKNVTFQEEYLRFLERYQIPYDERYVWD